MAKPKLTAEIIHLMRAASGYGMMDCKEAAQYAVDKLNGDFALGMLMKSADGFAVMIKSKDPKISDRQVRERWNLAYAQGERQNVAERSPEWALLVERSTEWTQK